MKTFRTPLLAILFLGLTQLALAADGPGAGTWKLTFPMNGQKGPVPVTFLIMLSESNGKWVGDLIDMAPKMPFEPTIENVQPGDGVVRFDLKIRDEVIAFEGKLAKDGKKVAGTGLTRGQTIFLDLYPSKLKKLTDPFDLLKETLDQQTGSEFFDGLPTLLRMASEKKLRAEEVRGYADRAAKESEDFGPRWQRTIALSIANNLAEQEAFQPIALEQARRAERMLTNADDAATQLSVLDGLSRVLKKAKKDDEAKKVDVQILKAEARDFADYAKKAPFKTEAYAGRKAKGDRVVLVELFTGSECPPCVAADLAFDGLDKTYKPAEAVFLEYHLHIPGPDPMTNKDAEVRKDYYKIEGTPSIYFSGKANVPGGGGTAQARAKYKAYRESVDELLEKPATAKLGLKAEQKGSEITLTANVNELKSPGEKITLRFALTEERVRFNAGNGLRYHQAVVRAMPGGAKGFPLLKAGEDKTVKVNVDELKAGLDKYLEEFAKEVMEEFPDKPLALRNLRAVAFIQDDGTKEVLQAVQVEIEAK